MEIILKELFTLGFFAVIPMLWKPISIIIFGNYEKMPRNDYLILVVVMYVSHTILTLN